MITVNFGSIDKATRDTKEEHKNSELREVEERWDDKGLKRMAKVTQHIKRPLIQPRSKTSRVTLYLMVTWISIVKPKVYCKVLLHGS